MRRFHVDDRLAALADGELGSAEAAQVTAHLETCATCHDAWGRYQRAADVLRRLTLVEAPPHIWASIDAALDRRPGLTTSPWMQWHPWPSLAAVAALLVLVAAGAGLWWRAAGPAPWDVVRIDGADAARVAVGEWVQTDDDATARIRIGQIGTVDVAPNTRMQVLAAGPGEHRLNLARGLINAEIVAPPRIFFVETPSSTVVDLGCAYTMEVDEDGTGLLRVTEGWASLERDGRESLVPAGASAPTRPGRGPGTPSFDDASERMRAALLEVDFGLPGAREGALDVVLSEARSRDTLTLWHLLWQVGPDERLRVFERLVSLTPLPAGIDRDRVLALEPETMTAWREELAWTW